MNFNIKRAISTLALSAALATTLSAQTTLSGYFVDDYTYRFQMNPAYGNSQGFVSFPGLGNLNISMNGNLHVSSILYNLNGRTTTFLNPGISTAEALGKFHDKNRIGTDLQFNIMSVGFKALGGYNTVNISARTAVDASLPGSMFSLLKEGLSNREYHIGNLKANGIAYGQIALNHSRDINSDIRVGATVKILLGAGYFNADMKETKLDLGEDSWHVQTDAEVRASVKGLEFEKDYNETTGHEYVSGVNMDGPGLNGFGLAFDLGAIYKTPVEGLTVSAAINDIGFISWSNDLVATTNGVKTFDTDRYTFNVDDNAPNSFEKEFDKVKDDLSALYELEDMGNQGGRTGGLRATLNIGAEYKFPLYDKLSFGLMNSTRIAGNFSWTDFRLSANVAPCKIFSGGINLGVGTFGASFGWLANLHLTGFNLFVGMDHVSGKLAKQGVPLSSNMQVNFGLNFPF